MPSSLPFVQVINLLRFGFGIGALLLLTLSASFAQNSRETLEAEPSRYQWKLDSTIDSCKSYSSEVAGKPFIAAKIVCDMPIRMEVVGMILRDIENYPKWMSGCEATKMVKLEDNANDNFVFWWRHHIPVLQDRDTVLRVTTYINLAKGFELVDVRSTEDVAYRPDERLVRMPSAMTPFKLEWIDREHTRVSWMLDLNVGDGVPPSIANSFIKRIPAKSMSGLAKMATEKKYIDGAPSTRYGQLVEEALKLGYVR
ncbi:MAG: hypothetical protein CFE44_10275 [Burkholderiales bacterium PBB4]|nr:MAG: hypothetical protein CFE44_10275 [Burkholderiales bacterium PBB4]